MGRPRISRTDAGRFSIRAHRSASQGGYISHTQYEFGSILKFIEDTFGLGRIGTTDVRATSIGDVFDYSEQARAFQRIPSSRSRAYFQRRQPSYRPVDDE